MSLVPGLNCPESLLDSPTDPFWWFLPHATDIDVDVLEHLWAELDRRLDTAPLAVRTVAWVDGTMRIVELLGLIAVHVEPECGDVSCWSIEPDGTRRRMGPGWPLADPFAYGFWLRFAFQRWAPHLSRTDFFGYPLNRPATIELDTGNRLLQRLRVDRRYWQMCDAFVAALGVPAAVIAEAKRVGRHPDADVISALWWRM